MLQGAMGGPAGETETQKRNARKRDAWQALPEETRAQLEAQGRTTARAKREARAKQAKVCVEL